MKHKCGQKTRRRRYKKFLAAIASAAVLSSTSLPGLPISPVHASNKNDFNDNSNLPLIPSDSHPTDIAWPNHGMRKQDEANKPIFKQKEDSQTLGILIKIMNQGNALSSSLNNIATSPAVPGTLPTSLAKGQILYQTNTFKDWAWLGNAYPKDMTFGAFLQDPRSSTEASTLISDNPTNPLNGVDFNKQFVIYAYLGSVATQGYGIGIESITQTDNSLDVTVRFKDPPSTGGDLPPTKLADFIPVNRGSLDFTKPIHITFKDSKGAVLANYDVPLAGK